MPIIVRTQKEINDVMNKAYEAMDNGTRYAGMSYEEGLESMFLWLTDRKEDNPFD